jgi:hypothetical protein
MLEQAEREDNAVEADANGEEYGVTEEEKRLRKRQRNQLVEASKVTDVMQLDLTTGMNLVMRKWAQFIIIFIVNFSFHTSFHFDNINHINI